jgi:hypothetical protein
MSDSSNTNETELLENKILIQPVKKPRGRPAKYKPEERQEKYKESSKLWKRNNYKEHSDELSKQSNEYQKRMREAYHILCDLWDNQGDLVDFKSEKYSIKIKNLVEATR